MATDTGTLTELVYAEHIGEDIMEYAYAEVVIAPYTAKRDLRGRATKVASFPKWIKDAHEDIADETTNLATVTDLETTDVTITCAEIGIRRDVTDAAVQETTIGSDIWEFLVVDTGILFGEALDDDLAALFASLNGGTAVGATGVNLSLANMVEAQATVRSSNKRGPGVYVLDDQQALDYQAAQAASTATTVNSFFSVATGIESSYLGTFMGQPVWSTSLTDTANTGADVVGAFFIDGEMRPKQAAFGFAMVRDVTTELARGTTGATNRRTTFMATAKWGVGEVADDSGVPILTDA